MAEIRLSKLTKQFSIGLARLVDFLNEKGANVEMNPNAKISDEYLPAIEAKFGEDQKLKADSEKVTIKLKEIIEMGSKKKSSPEDEEAPVKEVVIKSNSLNTETPKVQPQPQPQEEPAKEEETEVEEEETYEYTKYTDDSGSIVYVEYESGTYFIENYNYFAVDVVFDGVTHRLAAYGGVKVIPGSEPIYFTTTK